MGKGVVASEIHFDDFVYSRRRDASRVFLEERGILERVSGLFTADGREMTARVPTPR